MRYPFRNYGDALDEDYGTENDGGYSIIRFNRYLIIIAEFFTAEVAATYKTIRILVHSVQFCNPKSKMMIQLPCIDLASMEAEYIASVLKNRLPSIL